MWEPYGAVCPWWNSLPKFCLSVTELEIMERERVTQPKPSVNPLVDT